MKRWLALACVLLSAACASKTTSGGAGAGAGDGASGFAGVAGHAGTTAGHAGAAVGGGSGAAAGASGRAAGGSGSSGSATAGANAADGGEADSGPQAGSGGEDCTQLASDYSDALTKAKDCDASASGAQCQALVSTSLPCPSCMVRVNDATSLHTLEQRYVQAGCRDQRHICPAIACINPGAGQCLPIDRGDVCQ